MDYFDIDNAVASLQSSENQDLLISVFQKHFLEQDYLLRSHRFYPQRHRQRNIPFAVNKNRRNSKRNNYPPFEVGAQRE